MSLRRLLGSLAVLGLCGALLAGGAFLWWRSQGQPVRAGSAPVSGLQAGVQVRFDDAAVPHVTAASLLDLSRALGWLHANERMGQMELQRRYAAGRLAELVGVKAVGADREMRELGLARAAQRNLDACSARSRAVLEAYSQGVNAWLVSHGDELPPDLVLLRADPEPWTALDSLGIELLMAHMLSFSEGRERTRLRWLAALGPERTRELVGVPDLAIAPEVLELASELREQRAQAEKPRNGSNNWAVSAARSASGHALVANDPHLAIALPSTWYQAQLRCPEYEASGFTLPGLPMVVIGQSARVAWGFTNTELDVCDVFIERVSADGASVERDGEWVKIELALETIHVRGGETLTQKCRSTDIGPLFMAGTREPKLAFSLAWSAYAPFDPLEPFLALASARNTAEVPAIAARFVCPPQNLVCGDLDGKILYTVLGRAVERGFGDGRVPTAAWKRANHWRGLAPHEQTPSAAEPADALLVTANQDTRPGGFPYSYTLDAAAPQRAQRIRERLAERSDWTPDALATLQVDTTSLYAREVVALLNEPEAGSDAQRAWSALQGWDGEMALRGAAALYALTERELSRAIFHDELEGGFGHPERQRALLDVLAGRMPERWFDDVSTPATEGRAETVSRALAAAWRQGQERWGAQVADWRYGELNSWTPKHGLSSVPLLGSLFDREEVGVPGSDTSPCVFSGRWRDGRIVVGHGASLRLVADCADPDRSLAILPGGQSGHPFDRHYADQLAPYLGGQLRPMRWSEAAIEAATVTMLELVPGP